MHGEILLVDDEEDVCALVRAMLVRHGFKVTTTTDVAAALELVVAHDFDVVLTDLAMPQMSGLDVCERVASARPGTPVIVITGEQSLASAIAALRVGAFDFITKPVDAKVLHSCVSRAIRQSRLQNEVKHLRVTTADRHTNESILGQSGAMRRVHDLIGRIGASDASILIHGETGTGKELIARAIHDQSRRGDGPFVAVNCAAIPHSLIESELFGVVRGAFTDAKADRKGLFVQAGGGTLFLDEIGELPIDIQPKLLRALQERCVRPVGGNEEVQFDARIVAASNRNLEAEVREKRFREDLYYRINVVRIEVPPLRERGSDILQLAQFFLKQFAARCGKPPLVLSASAAAKLCAYNWPGNVRELENASEHAVALARFEQVTIEDLPEKIRAYGNERVVATADDPTEIITMDELERRYLRRVLALYGGNETRAAQVLGFDRRTLQRRLERLGERGGRPAAVAMTRGP